MAGITGQGTTFNLPNFVGELFAVTPTDTPFLSMIGGLSGGERANSTLFQWQGYDLRDADENRQRVEGANAPTAESRVRFNQTNVVEIHQEAVEVSYTKQAATGQYNSTGSNHPGSVGISGANPVLDELDWQVQRHLEQIARDVERSFIVGQFQNPSDNNTPRKTRGIMQATATNVSALGTLKGTATIAASNETFTLSAHGMANGTAVTVTNLTGGAVGVLKENELYYVTNTATNTFTLAPKAGGSTIAFSVDGGADVYTATQLTEAILLDLLQDIWTSGGIQVSETATLMCGATAKRRLTKVFITDKGFQEQSRTVGGVRCMTIETDFGTLNLVLNRYMPTAAIQVVSAEECAPTFLDIPGKGFLFQEPLAKVGAADRQQIYGEVGLKYGNEKKHGKLLRVSA
ncbi:SU10 major capsid protein [Kibdelosporangium phytohabitans]|uniref:Head protein n=1 Tax=Kibdelosporangium phytohabitans TaxID=860235 RepID=A0A0N9HV88_9PSEU|nr:DUF5309 family protein [Kibdelosporangium phytohabitans]ALG06845.1 hypothetical protein AOZ06_07790 [Kibdelosporangium phytohabitans]MBE1468092.1 hypothetical protein [Kibdelosporangium phytohabitans]